MTRFPMLLIVLMIGPPPAAAAQLLQQQQYATADAQLQKAQLQVQHFYRRHHHQ